MATATATQDTTNDLVPAGDEGGAEQSLRDTLEQAFEKEPTDEVSDQAAQQAEGTGDGRKRDEFGRFIRPAKESATVTNIDPNATQTAQDGQTQANQGQSTMPAAPSPTDPKDLKAPASWTPQAREEWGALPPRVKAEVHRREVEANRVVQDAATARQFISAFENVMRPYEMFIRAENSNPLQAVQNMMSTAAQLRVGTPHAKATLVAGICKDFNIDLNTLDSILAGQQGQPGQAQQGQQFHDPRLDQFLAQQAQRDAQQFALQQQQQQRDSDDMRSGLTDFAAKHEFYGDVSGLMADLVEVRTRQGQPIDIEQIYKQACQLHEGVSTILTQRVSSAKSAGNSNAVLRAKRAASSVRSEATPDGGHVPKDDSIRASLEAAIESAGRA